MLALSDLVRKANMYLFLSLFFFYSILFICFFILFIFECVYLSCTTKRERRGTPCALTHRHRWPYHRHVQGILFHSYNKNNLLIIIAVIIIRCLELLINKRLDSPQQDRMWMWNKCWLHFWIPSPNSVKTSGMPPGPRVIIIIIILFNY